MSSIPLTKRKLLALYFSSNKLQLSQQINQCFSSDFGPGKLKIIKSQPILSNDNNPLPNDANDNTEQKQLSVTYNPFSLIVPHGAYCDGGHIASHGYNYLYNNLLNSNTLPSTIILIGTNHRNIGNQITLSSQIWTTPFGDIYPNIDIINILNQKYNININNIAHQKEHSIENQLPFIQYIYSKFNNNNFKIVPILISYLNSINEAKQYSLNIINSLKLLNLNLKNDVIIIGTTDFTHAGPGYNELPSKKSKLNILQYTKLQDKYIIDAILSLNNVNNNNYDQSIQLIWKIKQKYNISMCGLWSLIITILCSTNIGLNQIKLLKYAVSSEILFRKDVTGFGSFVMNCK